MAVSTTNPANNHHKQVCVCIASVQPSNGSNAEHSATVAYWDVYLPQPKVALLKKQMQCDVYACCTCDRWQQQDNTCRRHAKTQDLPSRWKIERHITQQLLHSKRQILHVMQDAQLVSTCQCAVSTAVGISFVPSTLHHRQVRRSQEVA